MEHSYSTVCCSFTCHEKLTNFKNQSSMLFSNITSHSVSIASRRITLAQNPLRDLCSFMFGAAQLKALFEISYSKSAC